MEGLCDDDDDDEEDGGRQGGLSHSNIIASSQIIRAEKLIQKFPINWCRLHTAFILYGQPGP